MNAHFWVRVHHDQPGYQLMIQGRSCRIDRIECIVLDHLDIAELAERLVVLAPAPAPN